MDDKDKLNIEVASAAELVRSPYLCDEWTQVLLACNHVNALYASPVWVAHLAKTTGTDVRVLFVRETLGRLVGVVPFRLRESDLTFDVAGRALLRRKVMSAEILGGIPILPDSHALLALTFSRILSAWPNCDSIYFDAIPGDSFMWKCFQNHQGLPDSHYLYVRDGPRPWHLVQLTTSFDEYLATMSSKARANIRRELRQLTKMAEGTVRACRVTDPDQIPWFLKCASAISRNSWQDRILGERVGYNDPSQRSLEDLAARGVARSYILMAGEIPCAFVIGYQYSGTYHYVEIGFDEHFSKYSPGKILLSLILEDLHAYQRPTILNFGVADATYKRRFGNCERSDASCLILPKRLGNIFLTRSHASFKRGVAIAKKLIGRKVNK